MTGTNLTTAEVTVKDGKVTKYYLNVLQGSVTVTGEGEEAKATLVWNAKTKKELGDEYGMKDVGLGYKLVDGAWVVDGKSQKEWFEQAALIEAKFLADGIDAATLTDGRFDNIAGVTIKDAYSAVAKAALARWAK